MYPYPYNNKEIVVLLDAICYTAATRTTFLHKRIRRQTYINIST